MSEKLKMWSTQNYNMSHKRLELFLEFLIFGIIMGVVEDAIVINFITKEAITWKSVLIIILIAIPFAVIGELIVDRLNLIPTKKKPKK